MTTVLVVDDSRFMRTVISKALDEYGYTVETARNGKEAVKAVERIDPDIVTMDVQMPEMDGIDAVEQIMQRNPVPILMLSAHTQEGADTTLEAIQKGAVDFLPKPDGNENPITSVEITDRLVESIEAVSGTDVTTVRPGETATPDQTTPSTVPDVSVTETPPTIIIGASTGGPRLVENILADLPRDLRARVIVVQHMPSGFTKRFANRLHNRSVYEVREATGETTLTPGTVLVAKGDEDLLVTKETNDQLECITTTEGTQTVTPSIDRTLLSAANVVTGPLVAVLLTGMGADGCKGIQAVTEQGGRVIVQDEETSPVFGIPRRAINTGYVDSVLPDREIVSGILAHIKDLHHGDHQ